MRTVVQPSHALALCADEFGPNYWGECYIGGKLVFYPGTGGPKYTLMHPASLDVPDAAVTLGSQGNQSF